MNQKFEHSGLPAALIVDALKHDPTITNRALAQKLGCSVATISAHLKRLSDQRQMRVVGVLNCRALGYGLFAFIFIKIRARPVIEVAMELADLPQMLSVSTSFGQYELSVVAVARTHDELRDLILKEIARVRGVASMRCDLSLDVLHLRSDWGRLEKAEELARDARHALELFEESDEIDSQIIALLQIDGRTSKRAIAKAVGVSEGTVRYRLNQLEASGVFATRTITNPIGFGMTSSGFVGLQVDPARISAVANTIARLEAVPMVAVTLGRFDVMAFVTASTRDELAAIIEDQLMGIAGVQATETSETLRNIKYNVLLSY